MNAKTLHVFQSQQLTVWHDFLLLPTGSNVHMNGATVAARLARLLVNAYIESPGRQLEPDVIAAAIWPDYPVDARSRTRVKVAVCRLRTRGVPVVTLGSGYALDPRVELELAAAAVAA